MTTPPPRIDWLNVAMNAVLGAVCGIFIGWAIVAIAVIVAALLMLIGVL